MVGRLPHPAPTFSLLCFRGGFPHLLNLQSYFGSSFPGAPLELCNSDTINHGAEKQTILFEATYNTICSLPIPLPGMTFNRRLKYHLYSEPLSHHQGSRSRELQSRFHFTFVPGVGRMSHHWQTWWMQAQGPWQQEGGFKSILRYLWSPSRQSPTTATCFILATKISSCWWLDISLILWIKLALFLRFYNLNMWHFFAFSHWKSVLI